MCAVGLDVKILWEFLAERSFLRGCGELLALVLGGFGLALVVAGLAWKCSWRVSGGSLVRIGVGWRLFGGEELSVESVLVGGVLGRISVELGAGCGVRVWSGCAVLAVAVLEWFYWWLRRRVVECVSSVRWSLGLD